MTIPLFKVHKPKGIEKAISDVWQSGFVSEGEYSDKFESLFADYIGNKNSSLVNSCTSALSIASRMCNIQPGDEIISTPMTCMATNEPFYNDGAKIIWADIDTTTGNINPDCIENLITEKTKAIIGVHWAGLPFDIDAINKIAKKYNIKVIEDAAHAIGATYKGKKIGNHSDHVCFSFQAIKHITTGDGGAICSKNNFDDERIKKLKWFGLDRNFKGSKWEQDITESGFKYHMNNMNAAIGLLQMKSIDNIVRSHQERYDFYNKYIDNPKVTKMKVDSNSRSSSWIYTVLVDDRERFQKYLYDKGIASDPVHMRNDNYSVFREFKKNKNELPGVEYFCSRHINIPVGWWISEKEAIYIVDVINDYK
jgi:perosamine synthetase